MTRKRDDALRSRPPWLPGPDDITRIRADLDYALSDHFTKLCSGERFYSTLILARLGENNDQGL